METSFLNPTHIIESLSVEEGMKVAEFGSGTGIFSLKLAEKVGRDGKIYAVDVQKETLEALRARARMEGIFNIEMIWADLEKVGSTKLPASSLDMVFAPNMLFQCEKKEGVLSEAHRLLKAACQLVIIDWNPEKAIYGRQMGWPVSQAEMQRLAEAAGFTFINTVQTGSEYHYGLLFKK
jgi:ubiquinone/menaquinone biosynthesis C-methylase UbiE